MHYQLTWEPSQQIHAGAGATGGFTNRALPYVPSTVIRGAIAGRWWRDHEQSATNQQEFDELMANIRFSDALVPGTHWLALDQVTCKYPTRECPESYPAWPTPGRERSAHCPHCGRRPEQSKGERELPTTSGARTVQVIRNRLDVDGRARDDFLFQREALETAELHSKIWVSDDSIRTSLNLEPGLRVRMGAAQSVAGTATLAEVAETTTKQIHVAPDELLRIELLTPGVFVDEFGFFANRPNSVNLRDALRFPDDGVTVVRAFARPTVVGGWHAKANQPKVTDNAVVAHSVYHCRFNQEAAVPTLITDLGYRQLEGCGWAQCSKLLEEV